MRKERREIQIFSMSFLDVVSCGFGAIILLLVISKISEPLVIEEVKEDLSGIVASREAQVHKIRGETVILNRRLSEKEKQLSQLKEKLARLQGDLSRLQGKFHLAKTDLTAQTLIEEQLERAKQELDEQMRRLLSGYKKPEEDSVIGGVPVDSEYIIFVIDTSGSMQKYSWAAVRQKMKEILAVYPRVRGIQVMNDMGDYMFSQYAGRWIPDSPARRRAISERLASWAPFSNSSPVEGVTSAIKRFYATDKRISIYVFGDDFSRGAIQDVVKTVNARNKGVNGAQKRVRIHTVGFPGLLTHQGTGASAARFAALMRRLAEDNDGSFVGLSSLQTLSP